MLKNKWITGLYAFSVIFLFFTLVVRVDYRLDAPGNLEPLDTFITFETLSAPEVSLNAVYVMSFQRPTIFQWIVAQFVDSIDVTPIPASQIGLTNQDRFISGQVSRNTAIEAAVLTAFLADNQAVEYEQLWLLSLYRAELRESGLVIGDTLIAVDGHEDDVLTRLNQVPCGETVSLTFQGETSYTVELTKNIDECLLGLQFTQYTKITDLPFAYSVQSSTIGGPSSGMMQTLYIYALLNGSSFGDAKIAGTGTIFINGQVGSIGAVKQKVYSAHREKADVFFVPAGVNYQEALAVYQTLRNPTFDLVEVAHFQDVLDYLEAFNE
jgi:Lon-like protease